MSGIVQSMTVTVKRQARLGLGSMSVLDGKPIIHS